MPTGRFHPWWLVGGRDRCARNGATTDEKRSPTRTSRRNRSRATKYRGRREPLLSLSSQRRHSSARLMEKIQRRNMEGLPSRSPGRHRKKIFFAYYQVYLTCPAESSLRECADRSPSHSNNN